MTDMAYLVELHAIYWMKARRSPCRRPDGLGPTLLNSAGENYATSKIGVIRT